MIFSMHTDQHIKDANGIFGYSYGYYKICEHFSNFQYKNNKLKVVQNSPSSQIQMFYMEPEWYNLKTMTSFRDPNFNKFYDHQYKIYGTHLETTRVWSHWIDSMNEVDEIWVGNQFAADTVGNSGVKTPTFVFEHGIDDKWKPFKRGQGSKIRFLHVDSGSPRKRADLVEKAFISLFGNNNDVELTLKYHTDQFSGDNGISSLFTNINKIFKTLSEDEMIQLFNDHDVLLYPSEGEGFGFIPLQALATGMPVISTSRWCSYDKYFKDNIIDSTIGPTSYSGYFEGEVVLADFESLMHLMLNAYNDFSSQCDFYYKQAPLIYQEYNWQTRADYMLNNLVKRVGIKSFKELDHKKSFYVMYTGNGSYSLHNGINFTKDDPIHRVPEEMYKSLLSQPIFQKPTEQIIWDLENKFLLSSNVGK